MATAYSSEVAVGTYNRIRLRVEYNGTSAHCYIEFRRTQAYSSSWADTQASITFNGATIAAPYSYTGTVGVDWVQLCNASGFSVSTSGGTYSWTFNNPGGSSVLGCSGTIYIPSQASIPSGGYINGVTSYWDNVTGETMIHGTSAGVTNTGGSDLTALNIVITTSPYVSGTPRTEIAISNERQFTISDTINTRHDVAISPNSFYYAGLNATNSAGIYRYQGPSIVTVAAMATMSMGTITSSSAQVNYSVPADGGYYTKTLEYSIDGGTTWVAGATISTGSASTGSFTISGLRAGTSYELKSRVVTTAGTTNNDSVFFDIDGEGKLYGPAQMVGNLQVKGDTTQQTYSGKNLLNYTVFQNGYYNSSGTLVPTSNNAAFGAINVTAGNSYTITYKLVKTGNNIGYLFTNDGGTVLARAANQPSANPITITAPTGATKLYSWFGQPSGTTVDAAYVAQCKLQIEADSTSTPWEPYVGGIPAPNPDYPQEVQTVAGRQVITISDGGSQSQEYEINLGKNLFDVNNTLSNQYLDASGGWSISGSTPAYNNFEMSVAPSSQFAISYSARANATIRIGEFDSSGTFIKRTLVTTEQTFTLGANTTRVIFSIDQSASVYFTDLQIEKGSTATTYAPYFTPIELCKIGTYQDYIYKSGDDWFIHKAVGKKVFTGSESWILNDVTTGYTRCSYNSDLDFATKDGYSNFFTVRTGSHGAYEYLFFQDTSEHGAIYIQVKTSRLSADTAAAFKDWLSKNYVIGYYALSAATDTQITNAALITQLEALANAPTYGAGTTITASGSLSAEISANLTSAQRIRKIYGPQPLFDTDYASSTVVKYGVNGFTLNKDSNRTVNFDFPTDLPAGTYTISGDIVSNTTTKSIGVQVRSSSDNITTLYISGTTGFSKTFTANVAIHRLYFYINQDDASGASVTFNNVKLIPSSGTYNAKRSLRFYGSSSGQTVRILP